ncbi:iron ABC transporter ATP-binding protein FetA, partial [Klebsiella pneumoniae]
VGFKTDDAVILHNINFQLRAGEFKLITGPSGCGKSTLLKIIASLLSPTSGRLFFDDADVATLSPERYRQQVSYCAQTPALFGDSVYDNLIFPWQIRNKQPDPQALLADLQRFGLDENMLEKSINELSGGEKQRVSLIRNLQFLPRVLLLDEPTNHLDIETIDWLEGFLKTFKGTIIFISHDRSFIRNMATRIVDLDRGKLVTYPGNYDQYLLDKEEALRVEELQNAEFDRKLAQEEVWIRQGIKARRTRNEGRVRALKAMRRERGERREVMGSAKMQVEEASRSGKIVFEMENVNYQVDGKVLVKDFSAQIQR